MPRPMPAAGARHDRYLVGHLEPVEDHRFPLVGPSLVETVGEP